MTEIKIQTQKKRMANIELLRILAMMMVVMLHFLSKGNVLPKLTSSMDANGVLAWVLESLSIVAVNVYMIISGYFLVQSKFHFHRLIELILQVLFYSLLVPICLISLGILSLQDITTYQILHYIFPTQMLHYWFVTAYVLMYLFSPVLGTAVKSMSQKQLQVTLALLLVVLSVSKSILPVKLEMDNLGYDAIWFMCVYLIAAYIRLYGIAFFKNGGISAITYFMGCIGMFGIAFLIRVVYLKTGALEYFIGASYGYNHVLNLLAAVALFYAFYYMKIPEGRVANLICKISKHTFGVYLLHEQIEVRYLWPKWVGAGQIQNSVLFVLHAIGCVVLVFAVGTLIDMVRGLLFKGVGHVFAKGKIAKLIHKIDDVFR